MFNTTEMKMQWLPVWALRIGKMKKPSMQNSTLWKIFYPMSQERSINGNCLVCSALKDLDDIECIVVDGYVWLDEESHKGLGLHLYEALEKKVPIIGVAKAKFGNTPKECELLRGESVKPLFITAKDMPLEEAKKAIASMHGKYRFPTLLKEVDSLARENRVSQEVYLKNIKDK